ncbi:MAG: DUF1402 family protein [Pseudomonadota bacterium]
MGENRVMVVMMTLFLSFSLSLGEAGQSELDRVCEYDRLCRAGFKRSGAPKSFKDEIKQVVHHLRDDIIRSGDLYNVDPRAIAGAILVEHTINVGADDTIQNYIAKWGITAVAGKKFSFGFGQMHMGAALLADKKVAEIEKVPARDLDSVRMAMFTPLETLRLIAATLRIAQDEYLKKGVDISKQPEILVSLYNLGKISKRAERIKAGHQPKPNYFGIYFKYKLRDIENLIGWSPLMGRFPSTYTPRTKSKGPTHRYGFKY